MARCVVCGDEFEVDPKDDAQYMAYLFTAAIPAGLEYGLQYDDVLAWVEEPIVLAASCGPLVHRDDEVVTAIRLHGNIEAFYQLRREAA